MRTILLASAALALTACATDGQQTGEARDCFRNADVFGYNLIDNNNVSVRANGRDYILSTNWNARDLNWTDRIAIRSATGWICTGNGLGVEVIGGDPPRTYPISAVTRAPEEPEPSGS